MIPKPIDILSKFTTSVQDCKALLYHCLTPKDKHTDAGIEAAFLQFVKSWETFLEDSTLSFLCGEQPLQGDRVEPVFILADKELVRKIVYNGQNYVEWLRTDKLTKRYQTFFKTDTDDNNRLTKSIYSNIKIITDINTIRNEIAHSSFSTGEKIKKIYEDFNRIKTFSRPANFLIEFSKKEPTIMNFVFYTKMIELTAKEIIDK